MRFNASLLTAGYYDFGLSIAKKALKETVKNTDLPIPLTNQWNQEKVIGYITSLKYKDGQIIGEINLFKDLNMDDKAISSGWHKHLNYVVKCTVIDKKNKIIPTENKND